MYFFCFPPFSNGHLIWFAFCPLIYASMRSTPRLALINGLIAGFVAQLITIGWIGHVTIAGTLVLCAYLSLYWGVFSLWLCFFNRNHDSLFTGPNIRLALSGAAVWVTGEWIQSKLIGGFPWNLIGSALHEELSFIQVADLFGVYGVSFLVMVMNITFVLTFQRFNREIGSRKIRPHFDFTFAVLLFCLSFSYGIRRLLNREPVEHTIRIATIQPNISQNLKWSEESAQDIFKIYSGLTEAAMYTKPDLIVWPETATPYAYLDIRTTDVLNNLRKHEVPMLVGTFDVEDDVWYNAAAFLPSSNAPAEFYRKIKLVPFGEYVPLGKYFPYLRSLIPFTTEMVPGIAQPVFTLNDSKVTFATLICFEDAFATLSRRAALGKARFLINLTNDAWYEKSSGARQHAANAVFRCVETRRPMVRCTNTGFTCWIDERGAVRETFQPFIRGFPVPFKVELRRITSETFYTRHGDVFVLFCVILFIFDSGIRYGTRNKL